MTELIWEGKYNKDSKKTAQVHIALPFQTVEKPARKKIKPRPSDPQRRINYYLYCNYFH